MHFVLLFDDLLQRYWFKLIYVHINISSLYVHTYFSSLYIIVCKRKLIKIWSQVN